MALSRTAGEGDRGQRATSYGVAELTADCGSPETSPLTAVILLHKTAR